MILELLANRSVADRRNREFFDPLATIPVGSFVLQDLPDGRTEFLFASPRLLEMLGLAGDPDLTGLFEKMIGLLHEDDRDECLRLSEAATVAGTPFKWEGRLLVRGDHRWMNVETVPRMSVARGLIWEGVMIDVTERKVTEQRLAARVLEERHAREEVERSASRKARFLASVSHEIRTPLSAMVALTQAMLQECQKHRLPREFAAYLEQVKAGGYYLNHILFNLLDLSAIDAGHAPVVAQSFYLRDWVDDISSILEPIAARRSIRLTWEVPPDDNARFSTDVTRLSQIILNMGHNALKHGSVDGGTVVIRLALHQRELLLSVQDEGSGIDAEQQASLFVPYSQQPDAIGKGLDRGVGLGLAVVRENCLLLNGHAAIRGLLPRGMVFEIRVPEMQCDENADR